VNFCRIACEAAQPDSKTIRGEPAYRYHRQNMIYLGKSLRLAKSAFNQHRCLSLVGDEARCSNHEVMAVFVSVPLTANVAHGFVAPLQCSPEVHADLDSRSLGTRIAEAQHAAAPGRAPSGDPLVATWQVCACLDNALRSSLGFGVSHFEARTPQLPLHRLGRPGSYRLTADGSWLVELHPCEDAPVERRRLVPGLPMIL
jgi:hypothetical protein